jgi:hypothetical protein
MLESMRRRRGGGEEEERRRAQRRVTRFVSVSYSASATSAGSHY